MNNIVKKTFSMLLTAAFIVPNYAFAAAEDTHAASMVDEDYYYEEISMAGENAFKLFNNAETETSLKEALITSDDKEIVAAVEKTVYVTESLNEKDEVVNSHLMNANEVKAYKASLNSRAVIGEDANNYYSLVIYLGVVKDSAGNYTTAGTATWNSPGSYLSGSQRPSSGSDFVALTWGGEGYLKSSNLSATGQYKYNGGNISLTRSDSDTYHGYCWQFDEKTSSGVDANSVTVQANLKSTRATSRETNAKFVYIHTYQSHTASASLTIDSLGVAAGGITLSSVNSQWQIAVDVPGIAY